jgi:ubiquitin-conjugating enzyme E2 M
MLKLQQLKEKQKQQQQQQQQPSQPTTTETPSTTTTNNGSDTSANNSTGYVLKRQNSKELAEQRRQKSKESNVFTLRSSVKGKKDPKKKKANAAELRAHKDVTEMEPIPGTRVEFPDPDNLMTFLVYVTPSDGLYKGAEFKFTLVIPNTYPYDPPKATCDTLIYHPNIDWEGHVCLNILRAEWMPVLNLGSVIFGLVTLFLEPNPDDPLNKEAAQLMIENRSQFEKNVEQSLQGGYVVGRQFPKLLK